MNLARSVPAFLIAILVAGCGGGGSVDSRDAPRPPPTATPQNPIGDAANFTPNGFLNFVNEHRSLGAGAYEVVVGTASDVDSGSFNLRLTFDDGSEATRTGSWAVATGGGRDAPDHAGNPRFPVELAHAGGLRVEVDSQRDAVIFLVRGNQVLTRADSRAGGGLEVLDLLPSQINSAAFAAAYYAEVDPLGRKATLEGWKAENGFGSAGPGSIVNATFRDAKDLGYGRDMYAWERPGGCGVAVFEDNYVVQLEPGDASTYGRMNLDAAIERDRRYLRGSNALEFGPTDGDCSDPAKWIVSFYTFAPPNQDGDQVRLTEVDFDGRGVKFMPGICVVCHGGTLHPPRDAGAGMPPMLSDVTLKSSTFNVLNPASLEFSTREGFRFEDQRGLIEAINAMVRAVYTTQGARLDTVDDVANWSPDFALDWLDGLMSPTPIVQASSYVPPGWGADPARPANVETLYKQVIEPYCIGCHATRGTQVGEANGANAVNFSSWEKFDAYRADTLDYVFRRGKMPLSLIGYAKFWEDTAAPVLLADAVGLPISQRGSGGRPIEPGRAVARPGDDRVVFVPNSGSRTIELDGSASLFSTGYAWSVIASPAGSSHVLQNADTPVARLTVDSLPPVEGAPPPGAEAGTFTVRLVTSNERGSSVAADVEITFTTEVLDDRETVFAAAGNQQASISIVDLLDRRCVGCHDAAFSAGTPLEGIPVYFSAGSYIGDLKRFYRAIMDRVDLAEPENSLILRKPTATDPLRHGGGQVLDPAAPADSDYLMLLNWIRAGAPCGGNADFCDFGRDEVAPAAPSDLFVEAPNSQTALLGWRDNSVNEREFEIQRALLPDGLACADLDDGAFLFVGTRAQNDTPVVTGHPDAGLTALTAYCYRVRAVNDAPLPSAFTEAVDVTTPPPPPPGAPMNVVALARSDTQARVTWSDGGGAADRFIVQRRLTVGGVFANVATVEAAPFVFNDSSLLAGTGYTYRVLAENLGGLAASDPSSITTATAGATLYANNGCAGCHGDISAPALMVNRTFNRLREVFETPPVGMTDFDFNEAETRAICRALPAGPDCDG